jgi:hypothetical protein
MTLKLETLAEKYGSQMKGPDVHRFLPPPDPARTRELEEETRGLLQQMVTESGARQALGVGGKLLDRRLRRIAEYHALINDLSTYQGMAVGYDVTDGVSRLLVVPMEDYESRADDAVRIGIRIKHGGLTRTDVPALNSRWVVNLGSGLEQSTYSSRLLTNVSVASSRIVRAIPSTKDMIRVLFVHGNHLGDLEPKR